MISFDEAVALTLALARPLDSENILLPEAAGRTTAAPVIALGDSPRTPVSSMDGYAVRAAWLDQFVARSHHHDARLAHHLDLGTIGRAGGDHGAGVEPPAGFKQHLAGSEVGALQADKGWAGGGHVQHRLVALAADHLLDHHPVRAGGDRAAGEDAHGLAGADGSVETGAGKGFADHP